MWELIRNILEETDKRYLGSIRQESRGEQIIKGTGKGNGEISIRVWIEVERILRKRWETWRLTRCGWNIKGVEGKTNV